MTNNTIEEQLTHWLKGSALEDKALEVYRTRKNEKGEKARELAEREYNDNPTESEVASIIEEALTGHKPLSQKKAGRPRKRVLVLECATSIVKDNSAPEQSIQGGQGQ